jgi:phosphoribosylformimino-5-aminoimidazole carboxamide ribotide isomerase
VTVVPAIDIRGGKVVRLKQGRLQDETVYGSSPAETARFWEAEGAQRIHLVDLDAAIEGKAQPDVVGEVIAAVKIAVEVGGGLRVLENALRYRDRGADRVIFGTAAVARPGVVQEAVRLLGEAVAVAIDARDGKVAVAGWNEITTVDAVELAARVKAWGVPRIQYTDVMRDGTLSGPNFHAIEQVARASGLRITAAGGVSRLEDIEGLAGLERLGVDEVVVGKALYDGKISLDGARRTATGGRAVEGV